jgi:hypothetical protein
MIDRSVLFSSFPFSPQFAMSLHFYVMPYHPLYYIYGGGGGGGRDTPHRKDILSKHFTKFGMYYERFVGGGEGGGRRRGREEQTLYRVRAVLTPVL